VTRLACGVVLCASLVLGASPRAALAQEAYVEPKDETRLDVERLPPEAIEVSRDLYETGFYLQAITGGRGFAGGLGRYAEPGLWANILVGYELTQWLMLAGGVELSMHSLDAPAPPASITFERIEAVLAPRVQLAFSARAALWLGPEISAGFSPGDMLRVYGYDSAHDLALGYGGTLGFDWHLASKHHSLGVLAGARALPSITSPSGEPTISIHSAAYLKYVF
jgi:hypothetical protein